MAKKKVLIHTRNLSIPGGKQSYLIAIKEYFQNDVSYFYYGSKDGSKESRFSFLKRFFKDYYDFYRLIKKEKFDIVHINTSLNFKSFFRDSIFTLISRILAVKTVVYWHGWRWDFEQDIVQKIKWYFHMTFGKADAMVVLANEFLEQLKSYGYKKQLYLETTVVEDSIMNLVNGNAPIKNHSANTDEFVILFLSRVEKGKGVYETVDSFQQLLKKFPNAVLNIAGTGSELEKVKQYVGSKGIEQINFLGWISGEQKLKALKEADIFVLASYSEGMPISLLEAMAVGLSVVTTDVGGVKDFFEPGQMGLKVRPKDAKDLEEKFEKLLSNPQLMALNGKYNVDYAREKFSAVQVSKRLENIYNNVINGNGNMTKSYK